MFFVTIPAMAALGHDLYLFYENQEKGFMFAALGFIWTRYDPDSFQWTADNFSEYWPSINMLLAQKAFFVGLAFAAFFYALAGLFKVASFLLPGKEGRYKSKIHGRQKGKFEYKRK